MSLKEFIIASIALIVLVLVELSATHAKALLHQTPWLDEVHTGMLVDEADPAKFHEAMSTECVDANFPIYYQFLRAAHLRSLSAIRAVSLASTIATMLGIYVLLRGSFRSSEAAAGVLTVWSTPLMVYHAFQARFYSPWFCAVVWFAAALQWTRTARLQPLAAIAVAVTSILACTLHTLGLPAVALIVLADLLADQRNWKARIIRVLPALAGVIVVAMYIPLLIMQKHSFAIKSWLVGNPMRLLYSTIGGFLPGVAASVLVLAMFICAWCRGRDDKRPRDIYLAPLAGMSALIFFPLLLLLVTLVSQPVLLARYALICTAPMAAAATFVASRMKRVAVITVCVILIFENSAELSRRVREANDDARELNRLIVDIRDHSNEPALFESRHQLFPVVWVQRDLINQCAYIDFAPGPNQLDPNVEGFERDFAKKFQRVFGWPHVMPWAAVVSQPRFMLVALDEDVDRIGKRFAGYHINRLGENRFELTRMAPGADESIFFKLE